MDQRIFYRLFILLVVFQSSLSQRRIKDGNEVLSDKKYVVYLLRAASARHRYHGWMCGGAIITKDYVVTSAACVQDVKHIYVIAGYKKYVPANKLPNDKCIMQKKKKVVLTCVPTNYDFKFDRTEKWAQTDIAVIKVESPFDFNDKSYEEVCSYIPAPINYNTESEFPKSGDDVIVFGWGHNKEFRKDQEIKDMNQNTLHYASTKILDEKTCVTHFQGNQELVSLITSSMLCTLEPGNLNDKGELVLRSPMKTCITQKDRLQGIVGRLCDEEESSEVLSSSETTTITDGSVTDPTTDIMFVITINPAITTTDDVSTTNPTTTTTDDSTIDLTTTATDDSSDTNPTTTTTEDSSNTNPTTTTTEDSSNTNPTTTTTDDSGDTNLMTTTTDDSSITNPMTTTTDDDSVIDFAITSSDTDFTTTMFISVDEDYQRILSPINYDDAVDNPIYDENAWDVGVDVLRRKFRKNIVKNTYDRVIQWLKGMYGEDEEMSMPESDSKSEAEMKSPSEQKIKLRNRESDYEIDMVEFVENDDVAPANDPDQQIDTTLPSDTTPINNPELQIDTTLPEETLPPNDPELQTDSTLLEETIPITDPVLEIDTTLPHITIPTTDPELRIDTTLPIETMPPNDPELQNDSTLLDETVSITDPVLQIDTTLSDISIPITDPDLQIDTTVSDVEIKSSASVVQIDETSIINDPKRQIDETLDTTLPSKPELQGTTISTKEPGQTSEIDEVKYTPGICQNDHGGPLVAWKNDEEILIAVATLYKLDNDQQCMGPYLFTTTVSNAAFLDCIIQNSPSALRRNCDKPREVGFKIVRRHISWVGHSDGPADNERIGIRHQVPLSAFHPYP